MSYNTGNPVPSRDPRDLVDNAENLDRAVNGYESTWTDRLGRERKSWAGLEQEFDSSQIRREDEFQTFLLEQGYQELGSYENGPFVIEYLNQVFSYGDYLYRLSPSVPLPYTTQGNDEASWDAEKGNFVQVDFVTAQNLADERRARQEADANLQDQISGGAPLESSAFSPISWHGQTIQNSVNIPANVNAWSFGPTMTIAPGQSVTIGENSFWTIANGEVQ